MSEAENTTATPRPRRGRPPLPHGTLTKQNVRASKEQWDAVGEAARGENTNTSQITRDFYDWYLGKPGAQLPRRPLARQSMEVAVVAAAAVASRDKGTVS